MKQILTALFLFSSSSTAQLSLTIHAGMDGPSPSIVNSADSPFLQNSWSNGISATLGADYCVAHDISIAPYVAYAYYPWYQYHRGATIPEAPPVLSAHGDGSQIYRAVVEGKLLTSRRFAGLNADFYFTTGLGYAIEDFGKILVVEGFGGGPTVERNVEYPAKTYWIHTLGVATRADVGSHLSLDISAKYLTDYSQNMYLSFNVGIAYIVIE